jgi:hypothetical protein
MSNFAIKTKDDVKEKLDMLESLRDIEVATKIVEETRETENESLFDEYYKKLFCQITPIGRDVNYANIG